MADDADTLALQAWVEQLGLENMRDRSRHYDDLKEQGKHLLALLLTLGGAAFGLFFHELSKPYALGPLMWGMIALAVYLYLLASLIVLGVLRTRPLPAVTNTPDNLYQPTFSLSSLRAAELTNLKDRIAEAERINGALATWINFLQLGLVAAPAIFFAAFLVANLY